MNAPEGYRWRRDKDGLGVWEHRGLVAVAGVGHSPVERRWDGVSRVNLRRPRESGDPEPAPGMNRGRPIVA